MLLKKAFILTIGLFLFIATGCRNSGKNNAEAENNDLSNMQLFEVMRDSATNITFANNVREIAQMNALNYDYMYNGAGVSVADFNKDGLIDIYFVSNQQSNKLYVNKGNLKFEDVTITSNTKGTQGFSTGSTVVDINSDGLLDIYICKSGPFIDTQPRKNELYVNQGVNKEGVPIFKESGEEYNLDLAHFSTQAAFFDYDKDGDLDMFLINHNTDTKVLYDLDHLKKRKSPLTSDRLFRNDNGKFHDVSDLAGLINDAIGFGLGLSIGDLNNDNWPDVLVGQDFASKDRMYINKKDGTFEEVMNKATGHISNFSMGNDIADFNNDGWMDFMTLDMVSEDNYGIKTSMSGMNPERFNNLVKKGFHYQYMYNALQLNNGTRANNNIPLYSDVAFISDVSNTDWSWAPLFLDMDNDGDKDLLVTNGIKRDFRNVDFIHFRQRKEAEFDEKLTEVPDNVRALLERQRDEQIIMKMPPRKKENYFYENKGDLSFEKKNGSWFSDKLTASNGSSYADLDNDGDLDIIINNMDDKAVIYKNNSVELGRGNYLKVQLEGPDKNPDGIGARIKMKTKNGDQTAEQYLTRGFQSSVSRVIHFGLGDQKEVDEIEVTWPDGSFSTLSEPEINQTLTLKHSTSFFKKKGNEKLKTIFSDITKNIGLKHKTLQNPFEDFDREVLLPHKMSEEGAALAIGDVNNDGFDDVFIGGAKDHAGAIYYQDSIGKFTPTSNTMFLKTKAFEDVDAAFFDVDNDNDLDLYVVSGGNEYEFNSSYYTDRLYLNENGKFTFVENKTMKSLKSSGAVVRPYDFDQDGDVDLFVGGRQNPGKYPYPGTSVLLRNDSSNGKILFTAIEHDELSQIGMVTDAQWVDIDNDGVKDLVVVGEWMPITIFKNNRGDLINQTKNSGLAKDVGWWFSLEPADFDNDGDVDFIVGNLGLNSKYKASYEGTFQVYANDFDDSGSLDIVLGYHQDGKQYPLRGRECSSQQMPFIKQKFPSYHSFASADLEVVYGKENMAAALNYKATNFASCYLENKGDMTFSVKPLHNLAQITAIKSIVSKDIDNDGYLDIVLLGNMHGFEVETPRQDAGYGLFMKGNGKGDFKPLAPFESGLYASGDVVNAKIINLNGNQKAIAIVKNNKEIQFVKIN